METVIDGYGTLMEGTLAGTKDVNVLTFRPM